MVKRRNRTPSISSKRAPRAAPEEVAPPRDFVGIATSYAKRARDPAKSREFCRWVRLAAIRFFADLERAKSPGAGFGFDPVAAARACEFIELLPHVEGTWRNADGTEQPNLVLHESDVFFLVQLFGFRKADGTRRFTTALKAIARKNAKSTIAAAIGLYCECCEGENGPQVISGATTGQQARIVFNIAKRMVEKSAALRDSMLVEVFANAIACYTNGGTFKPINSKASTQDGLNPSATIIDEVHAHKTHDLINVLRSASGARKNPLFLFTTTEGYESPGPWSEIRHFARQVLLGLIEADHFLALIYSLDERDEEAGVAADDDFDERAWRKANPLMDVNPILLAEIRKEAIEARAMPGRHAEFKIKRLNRPASVAGGWINLTKWKECPARMPSDDELRRATAYGGLDLASTTDLASFRLSWRLGALWATRGWRFVPRAAVKHRTERGLVPFAAWVAAGYLIEAGEDVIDYGVVAQKILDVTAPFKVKSVGYDTWNASQPAAALEKGGLTMIPFIQGPKSYHPAMKELERAYTSGLLLHGHDPVLNWCASNIVARLDPNMNTAPDKRRSIEKIDDICALLMSIGQVVSAEPEKERKYQILFV